MAGLGGLEKGRRREGGEEVQELLSNYPPPPSFLPSLPFLLPDCLASPHVEKTHLIRSSYSTSFKGTLNDVFLGGDNCTLLLMQKEPLSRSTQDADTAVFEMKVCPHISGVSRLLKERGKSGSLLSFTFSQCPGGKRGGKEEVGSDIRVWQGDLLKERVCCNCSDRF